jgi:hypothetical protein
MKPAPALREIGHRDVFAGREQEMTPFPAGLVPVPGRV